MPTTVLIPTMGAALIGAFTSVFLYGITTLQTFLYYERFWHEDRRGVKYTKVVLLWLLETVHAALACHFIFRSLVLNFGDFPALEITSLSDDVTHGILGTTIFVVHCFYIHRLWAFTQNIFLTGLVFVLAVCHFAFEIVTMAMLVIWRDFREFHRVTPYFTTAMITAIFADVIIALSMAMNLREKQRGIKKTKSLINRLIAYIISTGMLTSVVDIITLGTFLGMPNNFVYLCFLNFITRLYANSMLALLNARASLRSRANFGGRQSDIMLDNILSMDNNGGHTWPARVDESQIVFKQCSETETSSICHP
ncbi:hypothetical protein MVEN_01298900 [Mycena venus]|uniref:DUF6534 domain-containing protein n=1 Tax=Mycena venus TaxID=2733690 RepID=A0A8H7CVR8_9AGAR|nr:hypothetical protein MVEN_01298900 [Mycena venus]